MKIGILFDKKVGKWQCSVARKEERPKRGKEFSRFVGRFWFLFPSLFSYHEERGKKVVFNFYLSLYNEFAMAMFRGFRLRSCKFGLLALDEEKSR